MKPTTTRPTSGSGFGWTPLYIDMERLMDFLQHLRDAWFRFAAVSHVTEHTGTCPHCDERTTWAVRMLRGYVRCRQCGRSPLQSDDIAPVEHRQETTLHPEPHVPA